MGHLMRSRALVSGMGEHFDVCFLNGGELIDGFEFPESVEVVNLPPLKSDENFKTLSAVDGADLEATQSARRQQILDVYERLQPEILVIELFPFGRKKLINELLPLLAKIRLSGRKTKVVCSLRDILVQRPDQQRFEAQVCDLLNRYFDLLLIHADPIFQRLEETFSSISAIRIPVVYTGYVAQGIEEESAEGAASLTATPASELVAAGNPDRPILLASIGGGRVGSELLLATVAASKLLAERWDHQLLIFTGPYMPEEQFALLEAAVAGQPQIVLQRYTPHFLAAMNKATLSISMAGYNTCMNVWTCGVRALMLPFTGGNNDEQTIRANKLAAQGLVQVLSVADLEAQTLAARIQSLLQSEPPASRLAVDGVEKTTEALLALAEQNTKRQPAQALIARSFVHSAVQESRFPMIGTTLRPALQAAQAEERTIDLFVRDDDIDQDEESLRHLLDIGIKHYTPISLAVIPGSLTISGISVLRQYKKMCPELVELHQHGWQHINHELEGRKCEFGRSRSFAQQMEDIAQGKLLLEQSFEDKFFPAFTPPWNRCSEETVRVLDELNFSVFSRDWREQPLRDHAFVEIPITLDLLDSKQGSKLRNPADLIAKLLDQVRQPHPIGLLMHHKVMDCESFGFFDELLREFRSFSCVRVHTLQSLQAQSAGMTR